MYGSDLYYFFFSSSVYFGLRYERWRSLLPSYM